ncbi:MAG: hypothetical protein AAF629_24490 [Chloroflexota bacterium]
MILRTVTLVLIGLSGLILAISQFFNGGLVMALVVIAAAVLWGVGYWRGIQWPAGLGLLVFAAAAALTINDGSPLWLMILCLLLAVIAWDLSFLSEMLDEAEVLDASSIYRIHFNRLGLIIISGLVLSGIMFALQFSIRPIWAIFIGLFVVFGISRTVRFLRQETD